MENENRRPWRIAKRLGLLFVIIILLITLFKFSIYFMPFFIAGIIALLVEPIIKFSMSKFKLSRRVSSSLIITLTILLIISLIIWGGIFAANKLVVFSKEIGPLITEISKIFEYELGEISNKLGKYMPKEVINTIITSITEFVSNIGVYVQNWLEKVLQFILSVPTMILNVIVTVLALIFFTKDRIYIIDSIEHHFPKKWIKNIFEITKSIFNTLKDYTNDLAKTHYITLWRENQEVTREYYINLVHQVMNDKVEIIY